jgi:hypothetical protein
MSRPKPCSLTNRTIRPILGGLDIYLAVSVQKLSLSRDLWSTERFRPVLLSSNEMAEMLVDAGVPGLVHEP